MSVKRNPVCCLSKPLSVLLLAALLATTSAAWAADAPKPASAPPAVSTTAPPAAPAKPEKPAPAAKALPKLVDLGADKCIPCRKMAPILEELKKDYAGQFEVVFIDVWKNEEEAGKYKIQLIPTQIFYDATGKERYRHEGFLPKADILAKWKELGVELKAPAKAEKK